MRGVGPFRPPWQRSIRLLNNVRGSSCWWTASCRPCPGWISNLPPPERLARAVESNVRWTVRTILESPEGQARVAEGGVKCVGAIYEIETGRVRFLDVDHD